MRKTKRNRIIIGTVIFALLATGIILAVGWQLGWLAPLGIGDDDEDAELTATTFTLTSKVDGEDVSDFVEISIWIPEDEDKIDEFDDVFTMALFDEEESSKDADDVSIDLREVSYAWVEIDPDAESVFETDWILIVGGTNNAYDLFVKHLSSDLNFNIQVRDTLASVTVASYQTNNNLTVIMDVDHYTTANIHANTDDWDVDDDDWTDMTTEEREEYYDEANFRSQETLYSPHDDLEKDFDDPLEKLTDAPCLRFIFNESVSTTDGSVTQINFTVNNEDLPIEVVYHGVNIDLIWYEGIDFLDGAYNFDIEILFASNISLSDVDSGRIVVPRGDDNLGAFTKYSDIGA